MANRNVSMQFGKSGGVVQNPPGIRHISSGEIVDDATVTFEFEPGGIYVLFTKEWTASTGAYRGYRGILITAPEPEVFGTTSCTRTQFGNYANTGITLTWNNDSTLSIKQSATTYNWRYSLYRVG